MEPPDSSGGVVGAPHSQKRNALLVVGAVSRLPSRADDGQYHSAASLYDSSRAYSSVEVCAASIMRHLVGPSGVPTDIFMHTWSFDLEERLRRAWNLTDALFEDNRPYQSMLMHKFHVANSSKSTSIGGKYQRVSWGEISYTLSVQSAVRLMLRHEAASVLGGGLGASYDRVLLTRPDIFLHTDLNFSKLERRPDLLYSNSHGVGTGDFHFVMERDHAKGLLRALQPPVREGELPWVLGNHGNFQRFVTRVLKLKITSDFQVFPGIHQDVYRKVPWHFMLCNAGSWWAEHMERLYGMRQEDWDEYRRLAKRPVVRRCTRHNPAWIMDCCCRDGACVQMSLPELSAARGPCGKRLT